MTNEAKLIAIKLLHTAVWLGFNVVIFYLLYAAIFNKIDMWLWAGFGLILLECLVLLALKSVCPLTILARKYSNSTAANFDIYLPNWLAKNNKLIYTFILLIVIIITIFQILR
jgi:hypothetical protein